MNINSKQIEAILSLDSLQRYEHFIKVIADWEEVWGLYHDGWALASNDNEQQVFPLWPAKEYAQLCADKEWADYQPSSFSLDELIEELLPNLDMDNLLVGIFNTPDNLGVVTTSEQLLTDLNRELDKY